VTVTAPSAWVAFRQLITYRLLHRLQTRRSSSGSSISCALAAWPTLPRRHRTAGHPWSVLAPGPSRQLMRVNWMHFLSRCPTGSATAALGGGADRHPRAVLAPGRALGSRVGGGGDPHRGGIGVVLGQQRAGGLVAVNAVNAARAAPPPPPHTARIQPSISLKWDGFLPRSSPSSSRIPPILTTPIRRHARGHSEGARRGDGYGPHWRPGVGGVELPLALPFIDGRHPHGLDRVIATSTSPPFVSYSDLRHLRHRRAQLPRRRRGFSGAHPRGVLARSSPVGLSLLRRRDARAAAPPPAEPGWAAPRPQLD